jgi:poly-gamma-glutamate capsule biosynthesis protein CapA/YwtB (metallophosphatase superfamily)
LRIGDKTIAFFAFTDNEPGWKASEGRPGIHYLPTDPDDRDVNRFRSLVEQAREKEELIVVSAHWGPNWGRKVPEEHAALAHCLVDSGADVVFGHSAHIFRAVEIYRDRPILYSTGDFVDDYAVDWDERNDESFVFLVELGEGEETRVVLYPTTIREFQANLAEGVRARSIAEKMQCYCRSWNTTSSWGPAEQRLILSGGK